MMNQILESGPCRYVLLGVSFIGGIAWHTGLSLRAEVREVDWISPADQTWKHHHYSTWHAVSCENWDDNFEGSQQPEPCTVAWFSRPGMVICLLGYLTAMVSGFIWICNCTCSAPQEKPKRIVGGVVFFCGFCLLFGWIGVIADTSLQDKLPSDALALPTGEAAREEMNSRWVFGLFTPWFFWVFGLLIFFYRADQTKEVPSVSNTHAQPVTIAGAEVPSE